MQKVKFLIVGCATLVLVGCSQTPPSPVASPSETPSPMVHDGQERDEERAMILREWREYKNEKIGFSVMTPRDWTAEETKEGIQIVSPVVEDGLKTTINISPIRKKTLAQIEGETFSGSMKWYNSKMWVASTANDLIYGALENVYQVADAVGRYPNYAMIKTKPEIIPMRAEDDEILEYVKIDVNSYITSEQTTQWNERGSPTDDPTMESMGEKVVQTFRFLDENRGEATAKEQENFAKMVTKQDGQGNWSYTPAQVKAIEDGKETALLSLDMLMINPKFEPRVGSSFFIRPGTGLKKGILDAKTIFYRCGLGEDGNATTPDVAESVRDLVENIKKMIPQQTYPDSWEGTYYFDVTDEIILNVYEQCLP